MKLLHILIILMLVSSTSMGVVNKLPLGLLNLTQDFNSQLNGVTAGTANLDAANMQQVWLRMNKSGDTMSGPLAMGSQKVTGVANGTAAQDAVTYSQLRDGTGKGAYTSILYKSGSNYVVEDLKGTIIYSGTSGSTAGQYCINQIGRAHV
jgi:hypothetical protein